VSDLRFTLPEIMKAARSWLGPAALEKFEEELTRKVDEAAKTPRVQVMDRHRMRARETLRQKGMLDR
jgi:hypothetical protein